MKFKELPEDLQKKLIASNKKWLIGTSIVICVIFLIITGVLFLVGHGFEWFSIFSLFMVLLAVMNFFVELKEFDKNTEKLLEQEVICSFSNPSASESN